MIVSFPSIKKLNLETSWVFPAFFFFFFFFCICVLCLWTLCHLHQSTSSWTERSQNENRKYFIVGKYLNCGYSVQLYSKLESKKSEYLFNNVFETPSIIISRNEELLLLWNCDNNLFVLTVCFFHSLGIQYSILLRDHNVYIGF